MNDDAPMLFGKYQGTEMQNVPASYLLYLWGQDFIKMPRNHSQEAVKKYIQDNLQVLKQKING